jgi:nicotinamidase-related amidase
MPKPLELNPTECAVLLMEMQRGVVGDLAGMPQLPEVLAEIGVIPNLAKLLAAARKAGVPVLHLQAVYRKDKAGTFANMPMQQRILRLTPNYMLAGSAETEIVPELLADTDILMPRMHGMAPLTDSGVDTMLRSLGRTRLIVAGVSLNLGVFGTVIEATDRGYHVVVPRDCVAGLPRAYGDSVLEYSLKPIATLSTAAEIVDVLTRGPEAKAV